MASAVFKIFTSTTSSATFGMGTSIMRHDALLNSFLWNVRHVEQATPQKARWWSVVAFVHVESGPPPRKEIPNKAREFVFAFLHLESGPQTRLGSSLLHSFTWRCTTKRSHPNTLTVLLGNGLDHIHPFSKDLRHIRSMGTSRNCSSTR